MEEKQLDFNQPILSVRRFSPKVVFETDNKRKTDDVLVRLPPLPAYKSDFTSGPVTHPGTVPFIWEQSPGRPKAESKLPTQAVERPPIAPNLPPGRVLKARQQDSNQVSKVLPVIQFRTGSIVSNSRNVTKHESPKEAAQEKASSDSDDDEAYHDALDTLSRTESFAMNCSVSGLSELDDQESQPSGSSSRDQALSFMIGRFLPAAKAVASGTPQYTSRQVKEVVNRQPRQVKEVVNRQPRQVKQVVNRQRDSPHRQLVLSHYVQNIGGEQSEDEDDNYSGSENYATKVCGLFPRLCLLNPIPGLRMEDRVLSSPAHGMQGKSRASKRETREHAGTAYSKKKSVDSQFGFREKKLINGIDPRRRGYSKLSACESAQCDWGCASPLSEKTLYVDSVHKGKCHSSSNSSAMKNQANHRHDDTEILAKYCCSYKKPSIKPMLDEDSNCLSIEIEKTTLQPKNSESQGLYRLSCSDRSSKDMHIDISNHSNVTDLENQRLTKPVEQERDLDQNLAISRPKVAQCKKILSENLVNGNHKGHKGPIQSPESWRSSRLARNVEVDSKSLLATKSIGQEALKVVSDAIHLKPALALPSLKAPSESWLKRTLPSVSSRNVSSRSYVAANVEAPSQSSKTSLVPKWETIVKYSKELLAPIPED